MITEEESVRPGDPHEHTTITEVKELLSKLVSSDPAGAKWFKIEFEEKFPMIKQLKEKAKYFFHYCSVNYADKI